MLVHRREAFLMDTVFLPWILFFFSCLDKMLLANPFKIKLPAF